MADPTAKVAMNAVCSMPIGKVALNRRRVGEVEHSYSVHLPENKATAQNNSGRCWMFAGLNCLRYEATKRMELGDDFELSQVYTLFWDKLEKANYFLQSIEDTLSEPDGSRLLDFLLVQPLQDGGQWHMLVSLIKKYGLVPKAVMPETESSSNTGAMTAHMTSVLRDAACRMRSSERSQVSVIRHEALETCYRILTVHLGQPPVEFDWQWRDKEKAFHPTERLTPKTFYDKYIGVNLDEYACLIHDPRPKHQFGRTYTVSFLGNVVGGDPICYLNVDLRLFRQAAINQLQAGEPVWFGCDVGKHLERDLGVLDLDIFELKSIYGRMPTFNKAERLTYGQSLMTHAMVFTGVDLDHNGQAKKWRVENSWSEKPGDKGFFLMTDPWFEQYMYEVVVHQRHLATELLSKLKEDPIELDPWDPMGSLA